MTEREKRDAGAWHNPFAEPALAEEIFDADALCTALNQIPARSNEARRTILKRLIGTLPDSANLLSPFWCDYGYHIHLGEHFFANHGCTMLDGAPITFGNYVLVGPNCGFYTPTHPMNSAHRATGVEKAAPITVGDSVWFGGGVQVLGGVTIGSRVVIGAGSVVTTDIPSGVVAAGNPCRVLRPLTEDEQEDLPRP